MNEMSCEAEYSHNTILTCLAIFDLVFVLVRVDSVRSGYFQRSHIIIIGNK